MNLVQLIFKGRTTTPWHIGERKYSNYLYTRKDILWGRGVGGSVLRQLWRICCPFSDNRERVKFNEIGCKKCPSAEECPFNALRGVDSEGEFKDTPRIVFTNVYFREVKTGKMVITSLNEKYRGVIEEIEPVYVEYIESGAKFYFEILLMGKGLEFKDEVVNTVKSSLKFFGWGECVMKDLVGG